MSLFWRRPRAARSAPVRGRPDYVFIGLLAALVAVGFVALTSASGPLGASKFHDGFHYLKRQFLFGLLPGTALFLFLSRFEYRRLLRFWRLFLVASLVLLVVVFVPGLRAPWGTSRSWITLFGMSLQPIEIVKLTLAVAVAGWLESIGERGIRDWRQGLAPFLLGLGFVAGLVMAQPDTGGVMVLASLVVAQYLVAGAPWPHLAAIGAVGAAGLYAVVKAAPYRMARFMTFLHPELDPLGKGYHINQAYLAIGSGGVFGLGLGQGLQKKLYLPEVVGDSVVAVMAEELGFVLIILFLALFVAFVWRGFAVARRTADVFGRLLATGLMAWMSIQAFLNVGSMVGLMPMTGLPFPFVSYGGTALFASLAAMGLVVAISRTSRAPRNSRL
jgi:cell division protein FtsW